jgi:hypothetical protein
MSAVSSTFSISSTTLGSSSLRPAKTSPRREIQPDRVRARPGASAATSFLPSFLASFWTGSARGFSTGRAGVGNGMT